METHVSSSPPRRLRLNGPLPMAPAGIWLRTGLRWMATAIIASVATLAILAAILHPNSGDLRDLALFLLIGAVVSLVLGEGAIWLVDAVQFGGIRLKMAIPPLLTALIIAFNVTLISRMMFISPEDGQLQVAFLAFGAVLALLLAATVGGRVASTVRKIETGARRIAAGEYAYRLPVEAPGGTTELVQLAECFNQMAANVQSSFERQKLAEAERRQVVAALSHDLRTPLASVRAMVEAIDDGVVADAVTVRRYQHSVRGEVQHLSALLDDLFELSKLESGAYPLALDRVALEDVLSDAVEAVREQAEQAGLTISGCIVHPLPAVAVDARQIHRVLLNLLHNSLRHTPAGGAVVVRAELAGTAGRRHLCVSVTDTGEGIAPADLAHVFEPTYRGELSRTRSQARVAPERSGLGLAIARRIVEAHQGALEVESEPGHGSTFSFTLPDDSAAKKLGSAVCA
jgi:two-component system, OmpR family, sensor histidine kinase SaeS